MKNGLILENGEVGSARRASRERLDKFICILCTAEFAENMEFNG